MEIYETNNPPNPPTQKIVSLHMQNACDKASINYVTTIYYHKSKTYVQYLCSIS